MKRLPSKEFLSAILRFDKESGDLFWLERPVSMFNSGFRTAEGNANQWNSRFAGERAFTATISGGYKTGSIAGVKYLAHRVVWKMAYGTEPEVIDHIDGNPGNNSLNNLRSVTQAVNVKNRKVRHDCRHGVPGISFVPLNPYRPWRATIGEDGRIKQLGHFASKDEAISARLMAEKERGYITRQIL